MKRPASAAAAKSAAKRARKPAKKPAKKALQKRVARPGKSGPPGAAWLKLVPSDKNEPLRLTKGRQGRQNDYPGVQHAGDIGDICCATGAEDFVNLDADLDFGTFQMPSVTKGGRKTTKKKLRRGGGLGVFEYRKGNPGKEIHQQWARVKAMSVNSALAKLWQFMAVTPEDLDTRCRYPESNSLELVLYGLDAECNEYQEVAEEIELQLENFMESEAADSNAAGKRQNLKRYQAVVVEACNEKRNGHVWGEENPKADMERLKKKRQKAKPASERRKIQAQIQCLKRQWQGDSEDEMDETPRRTPRSYNDSRFLRRDVMIIYFARTKTDPKGEGKMGAKACARVALSKRIYRSIYVLDPWTGKQYDC